MFANYKDGDLTINSYRNNGVDCDRNEFLEIVENGKDTECTITLDLVVTDEQIEWALEDFNSKTIESKIATIEYMTDGF